MKLFMHCRYYFFVIALLSSCGLNGQTNNIDTYFNDLIAQKKVAGVSVAILKNDQLLFDRNYGFADLENKVSLTDSTAFNIMSVTKIFIAVSIKQLADKNLIRLDESIRKYLVQLTLQYDSVLIYQLLNHSAGVPDYVHVKGYMLQANRSQKPWEVLNTVINEPLEFKPGEKNAYSNSGYFLLGLLMEEVTGEPLKKYLEENIFGPVGMSNTFFDDGSFYPQSKAKGYTNVNGELKKEIALDPSQYWAAGGIVSTKNDLIKWERAMQQGKLLPKREINQMMQPVKFNVENVSDYGLGFELMNTPQMKAAGNNGAGLGYNASVLTFLNDGLTIIVLTNTSNGNSSMIAKNVRDIVMNETSGHSETNMSQTKKDKTDTAVMQVFVDAQHSIVNSAYFEDNNAANKFKSETLPYIQSMGKLSGMQMQGEKINPQSIVRRYEVDFEKGKTMWVIIFSTAGKIAVTNHM